MFSDSFTQIEHGDAAEILDKINPMLEMAPFDAAMARVMRHPLSFYPGYDLVEVADYDVNPPRKISFICKNGPDKGMPVFLDGKNEGIYKLNKDAPIQLGHENIIQYTLFFFNYVRGKHGRFIIIQNVDDIDWREEPAPSGRKALGNMITPLTPKAAPDENGTYHLSSSILFKDSLFEADISVTKDGVVSLSNQELLVEDIPVLDDSFGQ